MNQMEAISTHHIRPEHLNHHLSLYGGNIADWMCEVAYVATAKLRRRSDRIVMSRANSLRFLRPLGLGDILELRATVERLGTTSIVLRVEGTEVLSGEVCCTGELVFVTVDEEGHKCPHGLTLPED